MRPFPIGAEQLRARSPRRVLEATPDNDFGWAIRPSCRHRRHLEYVIPSGRSEDEWRCPACHEHYEDPVSLTCGDVVCRACAIETKGICQKCNNAFDPNQLNPLLMVGRKVKEIQCHCPNHALGCEAVVGVLDVEHHLRSGCEWREEECDQCHQQVRRAEMAHHKDTTCARKPMACGYADVGCPTRCPQEDLAAHERDGVVAHTDLLRQRLAATQADLTQCRADLAQCKADLAQTRHDLDQTEAQLTETTAVQQATAAHLSQTQHDLTRTRADLTQTMADRTESRTEAALICCQAELAQTREQTRHELAAVRSQIDQLFVQPAAPEGLAVRWDEATKDVALDWRPALTVSAGAASAIGPLPVRYRVQATLQMGGDGGSDGGGDHGGSSSSVIYMGPECRCRYRFPPGAALGRAEARFVVVAMRGLAESGPSAPAICTHPVVVFRYDHDMDDRGLFYFIGTQGRTQPWRNPAEAGWVTTSRSSAAGGGSASDLTGRQPCISYTNDKPMPAWWQVDLGAERLFTLTRYTLRHSNLPVHVKFRLQSWRLEGSADCDSWRTLDEHTNEPNAIPAKADAMATFAVERAFPARYFRVLMTGPSPNGDNLLMLSGLEMYGTLRHPAQLP
ncbi:putative E3 ubiquitin-protein ligase HECTD1 [Paratrimastix pyriformis]|uniref:E3 ubiquitin-protein ligase HECTD1 n=1 Tax=Paratrimastix pyriformis TaxID=342808 RepID=A0ABQ8U921_9EUKA|nr:putative E3 ubiquitin-protein ligase HECTD1 [Paratrimastix pyriformis]